MSKIIVSVINDLVTDQRVHKVCMSLLNMGYDVKLVGRRKRDSMKMDKRPYSCQRMKLFFEKGPFFYAEYNIRLFFFLLFHKADVLLSNDLDTLLASYLISRLKGSHLVYDSHEYFTGVPELVSRPGVQKIWKRIESWLLPKIKDSYTVNQSIASIYEKEYGIKMKIVRNIPLFRKAASSYTRAELGLPENKNIILLQGAGINIQRGAEEAVEAMKFLPEAIMLIIGGGDVLDNLKEIVSKHHLESRIRFIPKLPFTELIKHTPLADIGLSIDKDTNINYRFSLPNKIFDYIQSGVPVLASHLVEIEKIIKEYDVGSFIESHDSEHIADRIRYMLADKERYQRWKNNTQKASRELCWENEEKTLYEIYQKYA